MSQRAPSDWHALAPDACLSALDSSAEGLSKAEVSRRLAEQGLNRLELKAGRSTLQILWDQFSNVMLLMLLVVAAVSAGIDLHQQSFPKDAIAILVIVILNGLLGYAQESKAQKALLALRDMAQPLVQVRRDGQWQRISSEQLVRGDLIRLEAGDRVPADARLLEVADLGVREAALTGEAEAVFKRPELLLEASTLVLDRQNCIFQGTEVVRGRGRAVVFATGMGTELGQIAELINTAEAADTPLQERLDGLAKVLVISALALVGLVLLIAGVGLRQPILNLLEVSLSMAVAIVPEGLPAVITVTLAIGTQRMVRRAALIRRLPAVEGLGSVTVICSDKTGTLTQNRMVVQELRLGTEAVTVSGHGYEPDGSFATAALAPPHGAGAGAAPGLQRLLIEAGVLCSDAEHKQAGNGRWEILGDPTEGALSVVAAKAGIDDFELRSQYRRAAEIPFSSERQLMAVWIDDPSGSLQAPLAAVAGSQRLLISKGAPEAILNLCERWVDGAGVAPMSLDQRRWWLEQAQELAARGLRVLAFACAPNHTSPERELNGQVLLGLMAQQDPARPEVAQAVATCRRAGIRPVMITGDHPLTARAIGDAIGLTSGDGEVILGRQLEGFDDATLKGVVARCSIYARVPPEQKLRIVKALQADHQIVAMTGDGVNDAPALKQAHIGVAMGITGTEVSKEAADMVLLDDNFATIVNAVEEGRLVYANIRRFVKYILGSNVGELVTIAAAPLLGLTGVPLTPLQILWMNLVTDGLPALALALEPGEKSLMQRPPAEPGESIFAAGTGAYILRTGVVFGLITIVMMVHAAGRGDPWPTMVFTALCLAQMGHALSCRSTLPLIQLNPFSNPALLGSVVLTTVLQLLLLYVPTLSNFFGTRPLALDDLLVCIGFSLVFFVCLEAEKVWKLWRRRARADA